MKMTQMIIILILLVFSFTKEIHNIIYKEEKSIGILTIIYPDNSIDLNNEILEEIELSLNKIDINKINVLIITENSSKKSIECDNNISEKNINKNILKKLEEFEIPIIVAINNYGLGIMFEILLISDIKICSENALLGYPLISDSKRLSKLIGSGMSKQIMFTKQIINAKEALRIGLVNSIYSEKELINKAKELGILISKNSNNALKKAKLAINEGTKYIEKEKENNIYKLKCACQNYDWGQYSNCSLVAIALKKNEQEVDENKKYAEYWMGTHPNGPSKIIKENKEILLSDEINGQLSYLFKILSINKPLSIQLHPDKAFAEILHKKYPKIYKDDNHKPELFIALSDFELLFGLVELNKAIEIVKKYKECFNLKESEELIKNPSIEKYKNFIERLIFLNKEEYEKILKLILKSKESKDNYLIKKLYDNYGLDSGILISLFMNYLHKKKGEAVFINENIPHSYIYGNCLELMACSDNVIRLGLTPKLVDKENFDKIVKINFEDMIYDKSNRDESDFMEIDDKNKIIKYDIKNINDFKLEVYEIKEDRIINIEENSILFCLDGSIKINGILCEEYNSFFVKDKINDIKIELIDGYKSSKLYKIYKK